MSDLMKAIGRGGPTLQAKSSQRRQTAARPVNGARRILRALLGALGAVDMRIGAARGGCMMGVGGTNADAAPAISARSQMAFIFLMMRADCLETKDTPRSDSPAPHATPAAPKRPPPPSSFSLAVAKRTRSCRLMTGLCAGDLSREHSYDGGFPQPLCPHIFITVRCMTEDHKSIPVSPAPSTSKRRPRQHLSGNGTSSGGKGQQR